MDELQQLQQQIAELQERATTIAMQNKANIISDIKAKITLCGITAADLGFTDTQADTTTSKESKTTRAPAPIKYRNGDLTWAGRGRKPAWLEEHIKNGGSIDDYLVSEA